MGSMPCLPGTNGEGENQAYPSYEEKACWSRYGRVTRNGRSPSVWGRCLACRVRMARAINKQFHSQRGLKLPSRFPAPNRDRKAFPSCGAWSFLPAPRPRTATGKLSLLAGPGASFPLPAPESRPGSCREIQVLHCVYKSFPAIQCIAAGEALFWTLNNPEKRYHSVYRNPEAPIQYTVYTRFYPYSVYRGLRSSVADTKHPRKAPPLSVSQPGSSYSIHCVYKILPLFSVSRPGKLCFGH